MLNFSVIYTICSISVIIFLFVVLFLILKSNYQYRKSLAYPVVAEVFMVSCYASMKLSNTNFSANLFYSLYYVCIDWFSLYILNLCLDLTEKQSGRKVIRGVFYLLTLLDSFSLIANVFYKHCFDLNWELGLMGHYYWVVEAHSFLYSHFALNVIYTLTAVVLLLVKLIRVPRIYKLKYRSILIAYLILFVSEAFSFVYRLPFDISIITYAFLAFYIYYFLAYMALKQLVIDSLGNFHNTIDDAVICFDVNDNFIYANDSSLKIFKQKDKLNLEEVLKFRKEWLDVFGDARNSFSEDEKLFADGKEVHCSVEYEELFDNEKKIGSYFVFKDRTDELNLLFRQHYIASHDSLTGIYNADYFFKSVAEKIKKNPDVSRLMIAFNIKKFKFINELFGVKKGDQILCSLAELLRLLSSKDGLFCRIADDKFAFLINEEDFVSSVFQEQIQKFENMFSSSSYKLKLKIGVVKFTNSEESASLLYDKAVMAMEYVSEDFLQGIAYYDKTIVNQIISEKAIISDFDKAIENNNFHLFFQPVFDKCKKCFGAKSLVRWKSESKGFLLPEYFSPSLEKTGLMYKLDLYIWEKVISFISECQKNEKTDLMFSINVSANDFYYIDVVSEILSLVEKYKINPKNLIVVFSEKLLSSHFEEIYETTKKLHEYGLLIVIDDYGQGLSSLSFIDKIHIDAFKVDMSLIRRDEGIERGKKIVEFIVNVASTLGIAVIANGIDNENQLNYLDSIGCNFFIDDEFSLAISDKDFEKKYLNFAD